MQKVDKYSLKGFNMKKSLSAILCTFLMAGCLEVEDNDSSQEVANALLEQNEILKQQSVASVNLVGQLKNISSEGTISGASIIANIGSTVYTATAINDDGTFEIPNLPAHSDYFLAITSSDSSFVNRVIYGTTRAATSAQAIENVGSISLSKGVVQEFSILDSITNEPISGLTFYGDNYSTFQNREGALTGFESYVSMSTYDQDTGVYQLTVSEDLSQSITVLLDIDGDGEVDYSPIGSAFYASYDANGKRVYKILSQNLDDDGIYFFENEGENSAIEMEVRVSLLDQNSVVVPNANFVAQSSNGSTALVSFDVTTQQYVATVSYESQVEFLVPAFSNDDTFYNSVSMSVSKANDSTLSVRTKKWNGNYLSNHYYEVPIAQTVLDIVLYIQESSGDNGIELISTTDVNSEDHSFSLFYSQPITIAEGNTLLVEKNSLVIVRGDDDANDLVLPGTTSIDINDVEIEHTTRFSLNNTKVTLEPTAPLNSGYTYQYVINEFGSRSTGELMDLSGDQSEIFEVATNAELPFDINVLRLDNNNYYTNGVRIFDQNSAGESATNNQSRSSVYLIMPANIDAQLSQFELRRMVVTESGVSQNNPQNYTIIDNGQYSGINQYSAVQLAYNENLVSDNFSTYSVLKGLNSTENMLRARSVGQSLYDNTSASENSITFEYAYETVGGETVTGNITLYVE